MHNVLPVATIGRTNREIRNFVEDHEGDAVPAVSIRLADLHTAQDVLDARQLADLVADYDARKAGAVVVARVAGRLVLLDGNHRAAAALLRGETEINARVLDWA